MSDDPKSPDADIMDGLREIVDNIAVAETRAYIRIAVKSGNEIDWERYGKRLFSVYYEAVKAEVGEEAAQAFTKGVFGRLGN